MFLLVNTVDFPAFYRIIAPGLAEIRRKTRSLGGNEMLPAEIGAGRATLVVIYKEDKYAGFIVMQSRFHGAPSKHYLQVVAGYGTSRGIVEATLLYIEDYARRLGCSGVYWETTRFGWARRVRQLGYKPVEVTLLKEIHHG